MKLTPGEWAAIAAGGVLVTGGALYLVTRLVAGNDEGEDMGSDDVTTPEGSPEALAIEAGVSLAQLCLARAIVSEAGGLPRLHEQAIGCATLNFARSEYPRLTDADAVVTLVLGSARAFGRQGSGGRRVSSSKEPARLQLNLAAEILAGSAADPTGGATQWDSPRTQRLLMAQGDPLTLKTPQQIADQRIAAGYEQVIVPGIDPEVIRFWRRA
jgi:hypothetical protein